VKAEEKTPETPQGISEDEAKSLIENAIKAALIPLQEANTALTEKNKSLSDELSSLKELIVKSTEKDQEFSESYQKHYREFKKLEDDFLSIEIRPGGVATPRQQSKGGRQITDAMILKSLGI
jgi:predicted RNase H-like nuclease (RuvC/YqgF family)